MRMQAEIDPRLALVGEILLLGVGFKQMRMGLLHRQVHIPSGMVYAEHLSHPAGNGFSFLTVQAQDQVRIPGPGIDNRLST